MAHQSRPFDLVILDLDGTILDLFRHTAITPRVQATIARVQAAGIPVTIGTGRTLDYVRGYIGPLNITTPVITTQGAVIGDPLTGHVLAEQDIPLAEAREIAAWIDAMDPVSVFYFLDDLGRTHIVQNRHGPEPDLYDHVFGTPRTLAGSLTELLIDDSAHPPIKFIMVNDARVESDYAPLLKEHFAGRLTITRTHPQLVEGTASGIDKGQGVRTLCAMLGVDPQRVLAIGDNDNDIPLLEAVGFGVAMGESSPGLRAVADWIAPPIEGDGAAVALEQWVLGDA
jgi:Cof subfamily protein (haloacid dehalogenase superfamily)